MLRSVLEGAIFSIKDVACLIEEMGIEITQIRTSGGGAHSDLWRQIHANVFNNEVITVSGSAEGGAYGAALVAGAGVGIWQTVEEAVQVIKTEKRTLPDEKNLEVYRKLYPIYSALYHQLKNTFDKLADIYQ